MLTLLFLAQVIVSWNYAPNAEVQERIFELQRSPSGCTEWALLAVLPADVMSTEDVDVPGNCYRVRAVDDAQAYPYSNIGTVPALPPPPPPPPPCKPRGKSGKCK